MVSRVRSYRLTSTAQSRLEKSFQKGVSLFSGINLAIFISPASISYTDLTSDFLQYVPGFTVEANVPQESTHNLTWDS